MIQYLHYLVRYRTHVDQDGILVQKAEDEVQGITTFAFIKDPATWMSLPSAKEGVLNTILYHFEPLTQAQFETYIEMELFPILDSDTFVISNEKVIDEFNQ